MIKQYSKKTAYVLIEKTNNLNYQNTNTDNIDIRICFKNNIEKNYPNLISEENSTSSIILKLNSTDGKRFEGETNSSQFFNFGSFESQYENLFSINDFDFITNGVIYEVTQKNITYTHHYKQIHPTIIKELNLNQNFVFYENGNSYNPNL